MELKDCAFPLVAGIETTSNPEKGFANADYALLIGSKPRTKGMERGDLLNENGKIFVGQGKAINNFASKDIKVILDHNFPFFILLIALRLSLLGTLQTQTA